MDGMQIALIIIGGAVFIISFLLPAQKKRKEMTADAAGMTEDQVRFMVEKEIDDAKQHINEVVDETISYSMEKAERSMDRITNEKMLAINEYSDTVLGEINKNQQEVVFLYDMLNNKHEDLKNTVSQANITAKEVQQTLNDAAVTARETEESVNSLKEQIYGGEGKPSEESRPEEAFRIFQPPRVEKLSPELPGTGIARLMEAAAGRLPGQEKPLGGRKATSAAAGAEGTARKERGPAEEAGMADGLAGMSGMGPTEGRSRISEPGQTDGILSLSGNGAMNGMSRMSGPGQSDGILSLSGNGVMNGMSPLSGNGAMNGRSLLSGMGQANGMIPMSGRVGAADRNGMEPDYHNEGRTGARNNNERILKLHKAGKSTMAIARDLGLGIGEVKLVIDLFEGVS